MPATRTLGLGVIAVTLALAYGIWYAYSVILVALLNEHGWSRSVLAGAFRRCFSMTAPIPNLR